MPLGSEPRRLHLPPLHSLQNLWPQFSQTTVNLRVFFPHLQHFSTFILAFQAGMTSLESLNITRERRAQPSCQQHYFAVLRGEMNEVNVADYFNVVEVFSFRIGTCIYTRHQRLFDPFEN
jgi:hypothetical protein